MTRAKARARARARAMARAKPRTRSGPKPVPHTSSNQILNRIKSDTMHCSSIMRSKRNGAEPGPGPRHGPRQRPEPGPMPGLKHGPRPGPKPVSHTSPNQIANRINSNTMHCSSRASGCNERMWRMAI